MSTKANPSKEFDCYANAEPDEPMFILLGRDRHAPQLVEMWAGMRAEAGEDPAKAQEALKCAKAMRVWRMRNRPTPDFDRDIRFALVFAGWIRCDEANVERWKYTNSVDVRSFDELRNVAIESVASDELSENMVSILEKFGKSNGAAKVEDEPEELPDYGGGMSGG